MIYFFCCNLFNCFNCIFQWFANICFQYFCLPHCCCKKYFENISHSHCFLLHNYTIATDGNVCNVSEICSTLFQIRCPYLWLLITTINIISHVLVCGTYLFYLGTVYIHNIFHYTNVHFLCWSHAFIRWM